MRDNVKKKKYYFVIQFGELFFDVKTKKMIKSKISTDRYVFKTRNFLQAIICS